MPVEPLSRPVDPGFSGARRRLSLGRGDVRIRLGRSPSLRRDSDDGVRGSLRRVSLAEGGSLRQFAGPVPQRVGSRNCPLSATAGADVPNTARATARMIYAADRFILPTFSPRHHQKWCGGAVGCRWRPDFGASKICDDASIKAASRTGAPEAEGGSLRNEDQAGRASRRRPISMPSLAT